MPFSLPGRVTYQMFLCVLLAELRILAAIARARLADHWAFVVWTLQPKHLLVGSQGWLKSSRVRGLKRKHVSP